MFILHTLLALCFTLAFTFGQDFSDSEILDWEAPDYLKTKYPYYITGYTNDGSPVFVVEYGKWNFRSTVEAGPEKTAELDKYYTQMYLRWRTSGNDALGSPGSIVIVDCEGMDIAQLGHLGVVGLMLHQFPKFKAYYASWHQKDLRHQCQSAIRTCVDNREANAWRSGQTDPILWHKLWRLEICNIKRHPSLRITSLVWWIQHS